MLKNQVKCFITIIGFIVFIVLSKCSTYYIRSQRDLYKSFSKTEKIVYRRAIDFLEDCYKNKKPVRLFPGCEVKQIEVDRKNKTIKICFNDKFSYIPFREDNTKEIYNYFKKKLGPRYKNYSVFIYTLNKPIEELIPNFYRQNVSEIDISRMAKPNYVESKIVRNISRPYIPSRGLYNNHIVIMPSHGWYYSYRRDRWEWQRPRLLGTVEDKLTFSLAVQYLVPMLENAGAYVFMPRERDIQVNEVIIDNDGGHETSYYYEVFKDSTNPWLKGNEKGFALVKTPYESNVNPFKLGTFRKIYSDTIETAYIELVPDIPEDGYYSIYISYHSYDSSAVDVRYRVYYNGGQADFFVNQKIGGSTWIYLGKFKFKKGINPTIGKVVLTNKSSYKGEIITADAVRFGGGVGNIKRGGKLSRRPRYLEGARYYLQYAGLPDSLVYNISDDTNDYRDDYISRSEFPNYLKGVLRVQDTAKKFVGLSVPIDLSLSIHTDAGLNNSIDTTIGTLAIYSVYDRDSLTVFPDSISRFTNRDLADIVQTQIVYDIRKKYFKKWNRRELLNAKYAETYLTDLPSMILELLSHQNPYDVRFMHDPNFKFDVSRAIYKGILKYLSFQYRRGYTVQPLPVHNFTSYFSGKKSVTLSWSPTIDTLEKSAKPDRYIVYIRRDNEDFDSGLLINDTIITFVSLIPGRIYSFKVTAVNDGGESFPSEILSVCWLDSAKGNVLIVNGFDRISAPEFLNLPKFKGFFLNIDEGVPYKFDVSYVGQQYNFNPYSKFINNDRPGFGASFSDLETKVISGNSFDYPYLHGKSIKKLGYSFVSTSDEAVASGKVNLMDYDIIDFIYGEEKQTVMPGDKGNVKYQIFNKKIKNKVIEFCNNNGKIFISGAYVCSDLFYGPLSDSFDIYFSKEILKMDLGTNYGSRSGKVFSDDSLFSSIIPEFEYCNTFNDSIYKVESPDAILPVGNGARTILRYDENYFSSGIAYNGNYSIVIFGFPFETILGQENRDKVMEAVFKYLLLPNKNGS